MEPIISPWLVYVIGVADSFRTMFELIAVISGIGFGTFIVFYPIANSDDDRVELAGACLKLSKIFFIIFAFFLPLRLATPDKTTIIQMIVAKNLTSDNIKKGTDVVKSIKNELKQDAIDIIQSIGEKK